MVAAAKRAPVKRRVSALKRRSAGKTKFELATARFQESLAGISSSAMDRALAARDPIGFMLAIADVIPVRDESDQRMKEQQLNAVRFKRELADEAGGLLEVDDVMQVLGHRTKQAIYKSVREHRLLSVEDAGNMRFPACQFVDGEPLGGLKDLLAAVPHTSGWRILQYLLVPEQGLAGRRPLDLLKSGLPENRAVVLRFAERLEA